MTLDEIRDCVEQRIDHMQDMYDTISAGLPEDKEGFVQVKGDLDDALKTISDEISFLSRLWFRLEELEG